MAVNLDGMFLVRRRSARAWPSAAHGSIMHTCSIYGLMGPDQRIYEGSEYLGRPINSPPVYSASKGGVIGLTRYLATYWADQACGSTPDPGRDPSGQNKISKKVQRAHPSGPDGRGRGGRGRVLFLASDAASYITGQDLHVDGGLSAW